MQRQLLQEMELRFSKVIQPDDLNILRQRILLLNKQWDELCHRAAQRRRHIQSSMSQWANFNENVSSFHKWIDEMEYKIITSKEYHIEDLLQKFSKVSTVMCPLMQAFSVGFALTELIKSSSELN
jgi:nesprin-1